MPNDICLVNTDFENFINFGDGYNSITLDPFEVDITPPSTFEYVLSMTIFPHSNQGINE
jgi:hypothetical protein